jgi:hypothetical protein
LSTTRIVARETPSPRGNVSRSQGRPGSGGNRELSGAPPALRGRAALPWGNCGIGAFAGLRRPA